MAITYSIAPNPHWVLIDNFSRLPTGAAIYTYRSLDPSTFKPAYQDAGGTVPYGQPIVGFGNGTMPPIFWQFDDANPDDLYYIRVYDSDDLATQQFLWEFKGISGDSGGGGGGTITTAYNIQNLIINGVFYRNIGDQLGTPSLPTFLTLAPSNNAGYVGNMVDANGPASPDVIFAKSNTSSTDKITFITFTPLGINALSGDTTPVQYIRYECTGAGAGETYKYIQFPIVQGIQNLSAQTVSVKIYARCNSGDPNLELSFRQFYGNGGSPTADKNEIISGSSLPLTGAWQPFIFTSITTPDATGGTLGSCKNDGLFLQVKLPLSPSTTSIDFIKPSVYLGTVAPGEDFASNDMINSIVNSPRTGDIRTSLNAFLPGWVQMNDGTIGTLDTINTSNATARANVDTFPLFDLIWSIFQSKQSLAPMYDNAGAPVAYGATSIADFVAYNQISLTRNLGRVMAGALPVDVSQAFTTPVANTLTVSSTASFITGAPVTVSGGSLPSALTAGSTYYAIVLSSTTMSLAVTAEDAIAGTPVIAFGIASGSGTVTISAHTLGQFLGQETYQLVANDLPPHTHVSADPFIKSGIGIATTFAGPNSFSSSASTGNNVTTNDPVSLIQPTVYMNVFIKL